MHEADRHTPTRRHRHKDGRSQNSQEDNYRLQRPTTFIRLQERFCFTHLEDNEKTCSHQSPGFHEIVDKSMEDAIE